MSSLPWGGIAVASLALIAYAGAVMYGDMPSPWRLWYDLRWLRKIRRECRHPEWRSDVFTHFHVPRVWCYECQRWLRRAPDPSRERGLS